MQFLLITEDCYKVVWQMCKGGSIRFIEFIVRAVALPLLSNENPCVVFHVHY